MNLDCITAGKDMPNDFNVVIEISAHSAPIKYEFDKASGALFVDRFISTSMCYPANYGFVPQTLALDGDPVDALLISPFSLPPSVVVRCRALGALQMEDEAGIDTKLIALPIVKLCPFYANIQKLEDISELVRQQIKHFFEHYKDLEQGKWVKVKGFVGVEHATVELTEGMVRYKKAQQSV